MALPMKMLVRDLELDVEVWPRRDGRSASFHTTVNGREFSSDTWAGLYDILMTHTKRQKVRVRVPYFVLGKDGFTSHVALGIHNGTGNVEVEGRDGKPRQRENNYRKDDVFVTGMTELEMAQRIEMRNRLGEVSDQIAAFDEDHTFNLTYAVRDAIEKIVQAPDEAAS